MTKAGAEKPELLLLAPTLKQGGFERVCVETARIMASDWNVTLAVFDARNPHYEVTGATVVDLALPAGGGILTKTVRVLLRARKLRALKRERKTDVSYSFGLSANLVNVRAHAGDLVVTGLRSFLDFDAPRRMRSILGATDLMISCSRGMEKLLGRRFGFTKTALLYNPIDPDRIRRMADEPVPDLPFPEIVRARRKQAETAVIAAMGREDDAKGYWHLLKAFAELHRRMPDARLVLIGAGTFERERALAQALGITDAVCFTGVKKNPFPYLAYGDLFVLSSNKEGFPNALLEAMALGLPVIAADCETGPREILLSAEQYEAPDMRHPEGESVQDMTEGSGGLLIPDMGKTPDYDAAHIMPDDRMLASAMERMLSDRGRMRDCGERAKKRAEDFSVARYRTELNRILEEYRNKKGEKRKS